MGNECSFFFFGRNSGSGVEDEFIHYQPSFGKGGVRRAVCGCTGQEQAEMGGKRPVGSLLEKVQK